MTHANGDYETYTYDRYGRVVTIGHYTQDGSLSYSEIYCLRRQRKYRTLQGGGQLPQHPGRLPV